MLESWEWLRVLYARLIVVWDVLIELVENFKTSEPGWQVVYLLIGLLGLALLAFFVTLTASKAASPFRNIPAPKGKLPPPPPWYSIEKRLEHYITSRYQSYYKWNNIGWFAPRLLIWVGSLGILGCFILKFLGALGYSPVDEKTYGLAYFLVLLQAVIVAYAHNSGRQAGLLQQRVPFLKFVWAFAIPLTMTLSVVYFELFKQQAITVAKWVLTSLAT
jgi:membrane protease YdiL (CAAX protease family)